MLKINAEKLSFISTWVNVLLAVLKLVAGFLTASVALISEGIHSFADVISSFIAFLGIKIAQKPESEKHPFGYARYESIAAFFIVLFLLFSAGTIIYEAGRRLLLEENPVIFSFWGIAVMAFSVVVNEIMSRWKFKVANEEGSLVLTTDAEHSRLDVLSSLAVLVGLYLIKYWPIADSILAIGVALYMLYELYPLTKEVWGSLTDIANPEIKEKIAEILEKEGLKYSEIKTRKVGAVSFAEIHLLCNPNLKVEEVSVITKNLEERLLQEIPELKQISIIVKSHEVKSNIIRPRFGTPIKFFRKGWQKLNIPKVGEKRIVVPMQNKNEISFAFGSPYYMIIETANNSIVKQEIVKNPYFSKEEGGRGVKFVKSAEANKVITKQIGESALSNLKAQGIEVEIIPHDLTLDKLLQSITTNNPQQPK